MQIKCSALVNFVAIAAAGVIGVFVGQASHPRQAVHAEDYQADHFTGVTNCVTAVPKSWGDFKGGSTYGLAFQDSNGVVRFILHPSCGSVNSPAEPPVSPIDLKIERE